MFPGALGSHSGEYLPPPILRRYIDALDQPKRPIPPITPLEGHKQLTNMLESPLNELPQPELLGIEEEILTELKTRADRKHESLSRYVEGILRRVTSTT